MASGIAVSDKCIDAYTALRKSEYSRVILKITDAADLIELESTHLRSAKEPEEDWKDFVKSLPEDSARYIISDFTVKETPTVSKAKILVLLWNPDGAPIRSKLYVCIPSYLPLFPLPVRSLLTPSLPPSLPRLRLNPFLIAFTPHLWKLSPPRYNRKSTSRLPTQTILNTQS